jgi:hypothetical protein
MPACDPLHLLRWARSTRGVCSHALRSCLLPACVLHPVCHRRRFTSVPLLRRGATDPSIQLNGPRGYRPNRRPALLAKMHCNGGMAPVHVSPQQLTGTCNIICRCIARPVAASSVKPHQGNRACSCQSHAREQTLYEPYNQKTCSDTSQQAMLVWLK